MRAGPLRQVVTFQSQSIEQDELGQEVAIWTDYLMTRASFQTLTARELINAQSQGFEATHKLTIRYLPQLENPSLVAPMRILYLDRIFNIKGSANIDETNREMWLLLSEGLNNG